MLTKKELEREATLIFLDIKDKLPQKLGTYQYIHRIMAGIKNLEYGKPQPNGKPKLKFNDRRDRVAKFLGLARITSDGYIAEYNKVIHKKIDKKKLEKIIG